MKPFDVYPVHPISIVRAKGSRLWDSHGQEYLDFYGGHAVISIGHAHPHYVQRITEQLERIAFYSNSILIPEQQELAEKLGQLSDCEDYDLFLCNSGAEANENAFKLASFHTGKKKFICMKGSFHGRTSAAVSATDDPSIIAPVNESENFLFIDMNDSDALSDLLGEGDITGVIIEGIQGVGGIRIPDDSFLRSASILCRKYGAMLILDEVQSGYGRTGKFFAHQHAGIRPDIITTAKGMGNGFPIAGVLIHNSIPAKHKMLGTTFGGNHLACAAGTAVLEVIENENLLSNAERFGNWIMNEIQAFPLVKEVRGRGLMIGVDFHVPAKLIAGPLLQQKHIFTGSAGNPHTMRLLPPLNISKDECTHFLQSLKEVCTSVALSTAASA